MYIIFWRGSLSHHWFHLSQQTSAAAAAALLGMKWLRRCVRFGISLASGASGTSAASFRHSMECGDGKKRYGACKPIKIQQLLAPIIHTPSRFGAIPGDPSMEKTQASGSWPSASGTLVLRLASAWKHPPESSLFCYSHAVEIDLPSLLRSTDQTNGIKSEDALVTKNSNNRLR